MPVPVTVAVVSWNTRELLARCLDSLAPESQIGRADVWVVDNASSDGSAELVSTRYPWAHLIASDRNLGFGGAVNRVAREAQSDWIAAANADVELGPGALVTLLATGRRDPGAGAVAPRLVLPDGSSQQSVHRFPTLLFTALFALGVYRLNASWGDRLCLAGYWDPSRPRVVDWAVGAFLLVRRAAWDQVGGFDENQWLYAEDLDLGWRLAQAGWHTRYEPAASLVHHHEAATRQAWGEATTERWMHSTYAWMRERRGAGLARAVAAVNVLGAGARWALPGLGQPGASRPQARAAMARWARLHWQAGLRPGRGHVPRGPAPGSF